MTCPRCGKRAYQDALDRDYVFCLLHGSVFVGIPLTNPTMRQPSRTAQHERAVRDAHKRKLVVK